MRQKEVEYWKRVDSVIEKGFRPEGRRYRNGPVRAEVFPDHTASFSVVLPKDKRDIGKELADTMTVITGKRFNYSPPAITSDVGDPLSEKAEVDRILDGFSHLRLKSKGPREIRRPEPPSRPPRNLQFYMAFVFSRFPFKEGHDLDSIAGGPFLQYERDWIDDQAASYVFSPTKYQLGQISLHDEDENLRRWIVRPEDMEAVGDALDSKHAGHILSSTVSITTCDWEVDANGLSKEDMAVPRKAVITGIPFEEDDELFAPNFGLGSGSPIVSYGRAKGAQKARTTYVFTERALAAINHLAERQPYLEMHDHGIHFFRESGHTYEVKDKKLRDRLSQGELHFLDPFSGLALPIIPDTRQATENDVFRMREMQRAVCGRYMVWRKDGNGFTSKTLPYFEVDKAVWAGEGEPHLFDRKGWKGAIDQFKWRRVLHPKLVDFFDANGRNERTRRVHYAHLLLKGEKLGEVKNGYSSWPTDEFLPPYAVKVDQERNEVLTAEIRPIKG